MKGTGSRGAEGKGSLGRGRMALLWFIKSSCAPEVVPAAVPVAVLRSGVALGQVGSDGRSGGTAALGGCISHLFIQDAAVAGTLPLER